MRIYEVLEDLNLTWEVRDGIRAHSWKIEPPPATQEALCVRYADRIAYLTHDALDAMRAGLLTGDDFPAAITARFGPPGSAWIGGMIDAVIEDSLAIGEVRMDDDVLAVMNELRDFMFERVYLAPGAAPPPRARPSRSSAGSWTTTSRHPEELPASYRDTDADRVTQAADYVAGMTDRFALRTHERLFGSTGMDDPTCERRAPGRTGARADRRPRRATCCRACAWASTWTVSWPTSTRAGCAATTAEFGTQLEASQVHRLGRPRATSPHFGSMAEFWAWAQGRRPVARSATPRRCRVPSRPSTRIARRHRLVIVSSKFAWAIPDSLAWLADHGVPAREVHFLWDKSHRADCDIYLDDAPHVLAALRRRPTRAPRSAAWSAPGTSPVPGVVDVHTLGASSRRSLNAWPWRRGGEPARRDRSVAEALPAGRRLLAASRGRGNPVAVVLDGEGLTTDADAPLHALDQPVRGDLPAAAERPRRPTIGCASSRPLVSSPSPATPRWAAAMPGCVRGGRPRDPSASCRSARPGSSRSGGSTADWPSRHRRCCAQGPVEPADLERAHDHPAASIRMTSVDAQWVDNGPGWLGVRLDSAEEVLAVDPALPAGGGPAARSTSAWRGRIRLARRAPMRCGPSSATTAASSWRIPVTGSLNASLAQWLVGSGRAQASLRREPGHVAGPHRPGAHRPGRRRRRSGWPAIRAPSSRGSVELT